MSDYVTKEDLKFALDGAVQTIITEMGTRFGEVNARLDRMNATLDRMDDIAQARSLADGGEFDEADRRWLDGRFQRIETRLSNAFAQLAADAGRIAGFTEWTGKANADYVLVLAKLAELERRLSKLEAPK